MAAEHDHPLDVLVVTGGHPFVEEPFFAIFDHLAGAGSMTWTAARAPAAGHDVVVFYDMPGIRFTRADPPIECLAPSAEQRRMIATLTEEGTGLVFMHHAIAGWPAWADYAALIGGRFHYVPGDLAGVSYPDSGYRFDVTHTVDVLATDHPVCAGLPPSFDLTDELYCFPVLEDTVVPLARTRFDTSDDTQFWSADLAVRGRLDERAGWSHPPGSALVAWARQVDRSRLVYLQFGDGPATYADHHVRRMLGNAIRWTGGRTVR